MAVLIDTSVLFAAAFEKDVNHEAASRTLRYLPKGQRIIPAPILSELFYMTSTRLGYEQAIYGHRNARSAFQIEPLINADMVLMETIMSKYADAQFDYADVSIMAVAERLKITRICTFDRRDFSVYRPKHTAYFELLP